MSRIGKLPVNVPTGVVLTIRNGKIAVKGPKGELTAAVPPKVDIEVGDNQVVVGRAGNDRIARAMHGMARTIIANMVDGVSKGFQKNLEIIGVGYKAELKSDYVVFALGYSHPIYFEVPEGIECRIDSPTKVSVLGVDRQLVGATAAKIRSFRPPEPYKGKGIKYSDETIRRKEGKSGAK